MRCGGRETHGCVGVVWWVCELGGKGGNNTLFSHTSKEQCIYMKITYSTYAL